MSSLHQFKDAFDHWYIIEPDDMGVSLSIGGLMVLQCRFDMENQSFVFHVLPVHTVQDSSSHLEIILPEDVELFIEIDQFIGFSKVESTHRQIRALFFVSSIILIIFTTSICDSWFFESLLKSILLIPKAMIHTIAIHTINSPRVNAFIV